MTEPTHATTEAVHAPEHAGGFPPFRPDTFPSQLLWFAICFVALYVMVARLALPRIAGILADRRTKVDADFAAAARLKSEADAAVEAHEKALADAHARAHALAMEAREKLTAESDAHRKAVEEDLHKRLAAADKAITDRKTAAMANVRDIAVDAASAIVARVIGTPPSDEAVKSAVDQTIKP